MTKKKPDIYTKTGKVKKPAAPKAEARKPSVTIVSLQSLLSSASAVNEAREKFHAAVMDEIASRTIKLWFGYSLVRPPKK